jgi:hypothetical protein
MHRSKRHHYSITSLARASSGRIGSPPGGGRPIRTVTATQMTIQSPEKAQVDVLQWLCGRDWRATTQGPADEAQLGHSLQVRSGKSQKTMRCPDPCLVRTLLI